MRNFQTNHKNLDRHSIILNMTSKYPNSYRALTFAQEREYILWLGYLDESVKNAILQISRWKRNYQGWDLHMFFVATVGIDDSAENLVRYVGGDTEFKSVLDTFRKSFKANCISDWRNNLLHRKRIYKNENSKGKRLPDKSIYIFGGYNFSTDMYEFEPYKVRLSDAFLMVKNLRKRIRLLIKERRMQAYLDKSNAPIPGMIPYTMLHGLFGENKSSSDMRKLLKFKPGVG